MRSIRIVMESEGPDDVTEWAKRWLVKQGYKIEKEGNWEPTGKFCDRMGITREGFHRIRVKHGCPAFDSYEGPTGRLVRLRATPDLERFCTLHKVDFKKQFTRFERAL